MRFTKHILLAACMALPIAAAGKLTSVVEFSVGGGWSSLGYKLTADGQPMLKVSQPGSYGFNAHVGYALMFNNYIGVGIGADSSRLGSDAKLTGTARWQGVTDTDGERYDHLVDFNDPWKDKQQVFNVDIPLAFYFRAPIDGGSIAFSGEVGAKVSIPVLSKATYEGSLSHTGYYDPWLLNLHDVNRHGFYHSAMSGQYDLSPRVTAAAFIKLGLEIPLDERERVCLLAHVYGNYHFIPIFKLTDTPIALGFHNDVLDPALQQTHAFMADYQGILATDMVGKKPTPFSAGVEIGIRIRIPHKPHYPCACDRN